MIGYCPRRARSEYEVTFEVGRTYTAPVFSQSPIYSAFGFSFSGSQLVREHSPDEDDFVRVAANRDNVVLNGEAGEVRCRELVVLSEHRFDRPPARPRRAAATDDDEQIPPYAEMH